MSLGRLSPQGAMMMFEAPYIGVSVPCGVPGRGTAVDDDDVPVEVQGFWTPDPRRAEKKGVVEDLAILDRLRPATTTHPRLQVQLAEELLHPIDEDDKSANTGEWQAVLCANLVPALSFDDHNPHPTVSIIKPTERHRTTPAPGSRATPEDRSTPATSLIAASRSSLLIDPEVSTTTETMTDGPRMAGCTVPGTRRREGRE